MLASVVSDQLLKQITGKRLAKEITLNGIAVVVAQDFQLCLGVDAFCKNTQLEPVGYRDSRAGQSAGSRTLWRRLRHKI